MRIALSTNWSIGRHGDGAALADEAQELGFDALELGFRTREEHLAGFRSRLDAMPVDSLHAYAPVPPGAPAGSPELHLLAAEDADERALAAMLLKRSIACAAELGARTVVLHAGYANLDGLFANCGTDALEYLLKGPDGARDPARPAYAKRLAKAKARRKAQGAKLMERFRAEFGKLAPELEKAGVTLALENLPTIEGFPDADEAEALAKEFEGAPLALWLDTGHAHVCARRGFGEGEAAMAERLGGRFAGMHLNDVENFDDDHLQPGAGKVDFAALGNLARREGMLRVFEPKGRVGAEELREALARIRALWG